MDSSCKKSSELRKRLSHKSVVILMLVTILGGFVAMVAGALVPSGDAWAIRWSELGKCGDGESSGWEMTNKRPQYSNPDANHPEGYLNTYHVDATCAATGETIKDVVVPKSDIPVDPGDGINCIIITTAAGKAVSCNGTVGPMYTGDVPQEAIDEAKQQAKDNMDANACRSGQALLSLGWFLCPIMEMVAGAVGDLYDSVESMLRIEPTFFTGGDNNVAAAWGTFRDMANVVFVILLLAVIFSQITGVGINNYGIKKILPKMIVAAIMINLSYVICQIAVDLSNILGNGLQNLFEAMGNNLSMAESINIAGDELTLDSAIANVALPSAAVLAAIVGVAAIFANPFILVSVLVSAISMLISLFFLFLLLVARKAAVIVLVALSPLAFVCYMLPNTKSLFDKWFKGMEGLLLLYPICGLIVGGGGYVSKLLLSTSFGEGGFVQVFAAMIVGIIPIFFIPTLLKNSFSAIGNIGAKISGIGQGLGKSVTGAVRNTDAYKGAQEMGQARAIRRKAGLDKNGNLTGIGKTKARLARTRFGRVLGYDKSLARSASQAGKSASDQEAANAFLSNKLAQQGIRGAGAIPNQFDPQNRPLFEAGTEGAYYGNEFLDAAKAGDVSRMNSTIQAMQNSNMQPKDIAKLLRYAESTGAISQGFGNTDEGRARAEDWRGALARQYGNGFLATDAELKDYMGKRGHSVSRTTGREVGMTMGYGDYAAAGGMKIDDLKKEDYARLSGDSFAGMAAAGIMTQGMAKSILDDNPNLSEDRKIMASAVANGDATGLSMDEHGNVLSEGSINRNGGASAFKEQAGNLMANHQYAGATTMNENGGVNQSKVEDWTAPRAQRVEIVPPRNQNNQNNQNNQPAPNQNNQNNPPAP